MTTLNWKVSGSPGDLVRVRIDRPAYVRLFDELNYAKFKRGSTHSGQGGWSDRLDVEFLLPYRGSFHVVVDLGGQAGEVKATCDLSRK